MRLQMNWREFELTGHFHVIIQVIRLDVENKHFFLLNPLQGNPLVFQTKYMFLFL